MQADLPTDAQMKQYADELPAIYRDIMAAFPAAEPRRRAGYGLAFQTITIHFANTDREYIFDEVREACLQLAENGFLEIKDEIFAHPTELGELLIVAVTGRPSASKEPIPRLPARTW